MSGVAGAPRVADTLLDEFGTLRRVINAKPSRLRRIADEATCRAIAFYREAVLQALQPEPWRNVLTDKGALDRYLMFDLADRWLEEFRVFYLDSGCALIREETVVQGSVNECTIYVRRIIERAFELGAAGLIVVHNHPSGVPQPSEADFQLTRKLARTAQELDIRLHEHLIVTSTGSYSWRGNGML